MKSSVNAERFKFTFMHYERNIYLLLEVGKCSIGGNQEMSDIKA